MAKWGTVNEPKKDGMYLVTIKTSFGNQVRQAKGLNIQKEIGVGL